MTDPAGKIGRIAPKNVAETRLLASRANKSTNETWTKTNAMMHLCNVRSRSLKSISRAPGLRTSFMLLPASSFFGIRRLECHRFGEYWTSERNLIFGCVLIGRGHRANQHGAMEILILKTGPSPGESNFLLFYSVYPHISLNILLTKYGKQK